MEKFMTELKDGDEETCIHILETEKIDIHKKDNEIEYHEKQYLRHASSIVIASEILIYNQIYDSVYDLAEFI